MNDVHCLVLSRLAFPQAQCSTLQKKSTNLLPYKPTRQIKQTQPHFGTGASSVVNILGDGATKLLSPASGALMTVFGGIASVYVAEFLALDMGGIWLPRISTSLTAGAKKPEPTDNWHQKLRKLNWGNFIEEFARELLTGPLMLVIPSLTYYGVSVGSFAKEGIKLKPSLAKPLGHEFGQFLSQKAETGKAIPKETFKQHVEDFIKNRFLKVSHPNPEMEKALEDYSKALTEYGFRDKNQQKTLLEKLNTTAKHFEEKLFKHNLSYNPQLSQKFAIKSTELHFPLEGSTKRAAGKLQNELKYFADYTKAVFEQHQKDIKQPLEKVANKVAKWVVNYQAILLGGLLGVVSVYLYYLTHLAQFHKTYPATDIFRQQEPAHPPTLNTHFVNNLPYQPVAPSKKIYTPVGLTEAHPLMQPLLPAMSSNNTTRTLPGTINSSVQNPGGTLS